MYMYEAGQYPNNGCYPSVDSKPVIGGHPYLSVYHIVVGVYIFVGGGVPMGPRVFNNY